MFASYNIKVVIVFSKRVGRMIMTDYIKNSMFYKESDRMAPDTIHETVVSGVRLKGAPLIILF